MDDTDERLTKLENEITELKCLIARLIVVAKATPKGRMILKFIGLGDL